MKSGILGRLLRTIQFRLSNKKYIRNKSAVTVRNLLFRDNRSEQYDDGFKILTDNLQVRVDYIPMETTAFFDVSVKEGITVLQMNSTHVFSKKLLSEVSVERREAMEICLAAWAKMERECTNQKRLTQIQITRRDWGQMLDDHIE